MISDYYAVTILTANIKGPCIYCRKNNAIQVFVRIEYPEKFCEGGMCLACHKDLAEFLNWVRG